MEVDAEFTGLRQKDGTPQIHVFDLLALGPLRVLDAGRVDWVGAYMPFSKRYELLEAIWTDMKVHPKNVFLVPVVANPKMCEYFAVQTSLPLSEGLVVRHKEQKHIGAMSGCVDAKTGFFKVKFR